MNRNLVRDIRNVVDQCDLWCATPYDLIEIRASSDDKNANAVVGPCVIEKIQ